MFIMLGLLALAAGAGFIGALSGLGGGVFIVPALLIFAHVPMEVAVGASMISVVATSAGASVAFVRDGWTNLRMAMVLECATVTGAVTGAYLAGIVPTWVLELLFALMMLQSAYFTVTKVGDSVLAHSDALAERLKLGGRITGRKWRAGSRLWGHQRAGRRDPDGGGGADVGAARNRLGSAQGDGDGLRDASAAEGL